MKKFVMSCLGIVAIALGLAPASRAAEPDDIGLDFSYPPAQAEPPPVEASVATYSNSGNSGVTPLSLPSGGITIPSGKADASKAVTELPPPPLVKTAPAEPIPTEPAAAKPAAVEPSPIEIAPAEPIAESTPAPTAPVSLQFAPDPVADLPAPAAPAEMASASKPVEVAEAPSASPELDHLFEGKTDSLIARAIGSAEGTRTPDGQKTKAYRGHKDPGNGKWNQGTFSYQHEASSPEEADQRQLKRLRQQAETLQQQAQERGLQLSLEEQLNALDLANQSPRAALSKGGYIDRLKQAREMGLQNSEAVLWARTRAFLDPNTQRWNAPGLGNTVERITADQSRRQRAIARAIEAGTSSKTPGASPASSPTLTPQQEDDLAGKIIDFNLS